MWAVMMTGMMLPGAAPTVLFYAALVRKGAERDAVYPAVWIFTGGYLAAWAAFSLGAAALQAALEEAMLVTPVIASASSGLSAGVLIAAGVYQWLPLKEVCLSKCRHPLEFFTMRWRAGTLGAFRMGLEHGIYCVGCCWMLMLLLFVAGVMNLLWVAFIAVFVFVEKLAPAQRYVSGAAGITLISTGLLVAALS
jgi:predicted metal-binding membrane protein